MGTEKRPNGFARFCGIFFLFGIRKEYSTEYAADRSPLFTLEICKVMQLAGARHIVF